MASPSATITRLEIENYRSIRSLDLELAPLTVVTGANGVGKSNLYRALELLQAAAVGDLSARLAREGGLGSAVWAGDAWRDEEEKARMARARAPGPMQIRLSATLGDFDYALAIGAPRPTDAALGLDPVVKAERARMRRRGRWSVLAERKGPVFSARGDDGRMKPVMTGLWLFETALSAVSEPAELSEIDWLRRRLAAMRFYHQLRVDPDAPSRRPQPAIMTTSVRSTGDDWAPAIASRALIEADGFDDSPPARAVAAAFAEGAFAIDASGPEVAVGLQTAEFRRAFSARELSDGTLRYLILVSALSALRPPGFIALNEPESSLHESLIEPLADLIAAASAESQILVVTHSATLADRLDIEHGARRLRLEKVQGETAVAS